MRRKQYIFILSLFSLFIPKVYALSYNINTDVNVVAKVGEKREIAVSIENIKDTIDGVSACMLKLKFDDNIKLDGVPRTLSDWSMTVGNKYLFDTGNPVKNKTSIFKIPVIVNGEGSVYIENILCSDGVVEEGDTDKIITFSIQKEENKNTQSNDKNDKPTNNNNNKPSNGGNNSSNNEAVKPSNCNLSDIKLSEGSIEFDPNVTEYEVKIHDFDNFMIYPELEDIYTATYTVDKNVTEDGGNVVITVTGEDGTNKIYTIYTTLKKDNKKETKNNYVPIFIGVIVILLLINVIRIIKNSKKNKEQY